jgi:alanine dehydrogenase
MSDPKKRVPISPDILSEIKTQPERLAILNRPNKLYIGVPREVTLHENRVALVPSSVRTLVGHGHRILIESDAGLRAHFSDHDYSEAGAEIVHSPEQVYAANVIIKVAPPTLDELELMRPNQVLISPLQLPLLTSEYMLRLKNKRVIALAMEYIRDDSGAYPIVRTMSELAGMSAILIASELLSSASGNKGVLLGGISGVPPAKVVILGAGVVAENAVRAALGLGAEVRVFDDNIYKLKRLRNEVGQSIYTSVINPFYLEAELKQADVVIGAIHSENGRTPMVVSEAMVEMMAPGSVIIDVSIDQGGCFETSEVTTLKKPTFEKFDVIHYCVPNLASRVGRSASIAVSNILTPLLLKAGSTGSIEHVLFSDSGLRHGVYTYKGCLTNAYLSERFGQKYTDLALLITSNM